MARQKGTETLRKAVERLDQDLWHQLEEVWRRAGGGAHDAQGGKDGQQRGTPHCAAVEANLGALIPDERKGSEFKATDLFVLSAAAALHDVGRGAGDHDHDHGLLSMRELRRRPGDFGLDQGQAEVVGWVVRPHSDGDIEALPHGTVPMGSGRLSVNVRRLAAVLALADALHAEYTRCPDQLAGMGGRDPDDDPKMVFRRCVRGWEFDAADRISLYVVPERQADLPIIATGLEKTRSELKPFLALLRDQDIPCDLSLRRDLAQVETAAKAATDEARERERAFLEMDCFQEEDAGCFKGRHLDTQVLFDRVLGSPLTLLIGDSGAGKTSLLMAGLWPLLHQAGIVAAWARPFDDPVKYVSVVLYGVGKPQGGTLRERVGSLCHDLHDRDLVLALDQFEDLFEAPVPGAIDAISDLLRAAAAKCFRRFHLVLAYRSDAEACVGPLLERAIGGTGACPRVYLRGLDENGAAAALDAGFDRAQVGVSMELLRTIAAELKAESRGNEVYPPYVQMVGATLCRQAQAAGGILSEELRQAAGPCGEIIGKYLFERLKTLGPEENAAKAVLVTLVRSSGVKGRRERDGILAETRMEPEALDEVLGKLTRMRMIRPLAGGVFEIIHDRLAAMVDERLVSDADREFHALRELLAARARLYVTDHLPLWPPDIARLYEVRERIVPSPAEIALLTPSCLIGLGPAWYWLAGPEGGPVQCRAAILAVLEDQEAAVRRAAVAALAKLGTHDDLPLLKPRLEDQDCRVRQAAVSAFAKLATRDDLPLLKLRLEDWAADVRLAVITTLAELGTRDDLPLLRPRLEDQDWQVRHAAVSAFANLATRNELPLLKPRLEDQDCRVRLAAAAAFAKLAIHDDFPLVKQWLEDQNSPLGLAAVVAFAKLGTHHDLPLLKQWLDASHRQIREAAVEALATLTTRDDLPLLRQWLEDHNWQVREAAVRALGKLATRDDLALLRPRTMERHTLVREAAAKVVAKLATRDDLPLLRQWLEDQDWHVREAAVRALGKLATRDELPLLLPGLSDRNSAVCRTVVGAFARLGARDDLPVLKQWLEDQNPELRQGAVAAIATLATRDDLPLLKQRLEDESSRVRQVAAAALRPWLTEADLGELAGTTARLFLSGIGEEAMELLIYLDRKFYAPWLLDPEPEVADEDE